MRKTITVFLIWFVLIGTGFYFGTNFAIQKISEFAIDPLKRFVKRMDLGLSELTFGKVTYIPISTVKWRDVDGLLNKLRAGKEVSDGGFKLRMDEIILTADFGKREVVFSGKGIHLKPDQMRTAAAGQESLPPNRGRMDVDFVRFSVEVDLFHLASIEPKADGVSRELSRFFKTGKTLLPIEFNGISTFTIEEKEVFLTLRAKKDGPETVLISKKDDLRRISGSLTQKLSEPEIDLLATHPVESPRLLRIKEKAASVAKRAHEEDSGIPEDAYRHVLWSYLLTDEFGEEFAKKVTDAHEMGDPDLGKEADHAMDYNNNAIGRRYAKAGYTESSILQRLLNDPDVILSVTAGPPAN